MGIKQLVEQWSWQSPRFEITSIGLVLTGLAASAVLFYSFGGYGLFALFIAALGVGYFFWYRWVAAKLRAIPTGSDEDIEIEGIVLCGTQAPGKMILEKDKIRFYNILGLNVEIPSDQAQLIHVKLFFNGQYMPGKRAIVFDRTDLAISVGKSWSDRIKELL